MPKMKKGRHDYPVKTPTKRRKRKPGSRPYNNQGKRDAAYLAFQSVPHLSYINYLLKTERKQCSTILGGELVWLKKENPKKPGKFMSFPIIIDGTRCDQPAILSFRKEGKNEYRCRCHKPSEFHIPDEDA